MQIELTPLEAGTLRYALRRHLAHVDGLLGEKAALAFWPEERRELCALADRLRDIAESAIPTGDIDACENVYADDHEFI
jgi:hypothetical protein